jgi:hypothetical protein
MNRLAQDLQSSQELRVRASTLLMRESSSHRELARTPAWYLSFFRLRSENGFNSGEYRSFDNTNRRRLRYIAWGRLSIVL